MCLSKKKYHLEQRCQTKGGVCKHNGQNFTSFGKKMLQIQTFRQKQVRICLEIPKLVNLIAYASQIGLYSSACPGSRIQFNFDK